jgi:Na+-transporting methylmalonyl-CoA/oxaloacetate decarboxylase gamma subunit
MPDVTEAWANTGKIIERDYTPEEAKQRKADEKSERERQAEEERQAQARIAAVAHAKTLGFTDEMIAVMYPGLIAQ